MKRKVSLRLYLVSILSVLLVFGAFTYPKIEGYKKRIKELENNKNVNQGNGIDFEDSDRLQNIFDILMNEYREKLDSEVLINGAIAGMIDSLDDPYTTYMNAEEASNFQEQMEGEYQGIGAGLYESKGSVYIEYTFKDSPAEKAGVLPHDKIVEVDGTDVREYSSTDIVTLVRGDKGTDVTIGFERQGVSEIVYITITRDTIPLNTVTAKKFNVNDKVIGYLEITRVGQKTYTETVNGLSQLGEIDSLIVDVRKNPGGYLHIIQQIIDLFVGDTKPYIQIEDRDGNVEEYYVTKRKVDYEVVVLIDEYSASASEIFAAALNQIEGFELVGKKTFGKGTVQTIKDFSDGSNLKYTIQKFLSPDGEWLHGKGVDPTIEVEQPDYFYFYRVVVEDELKMNIYSEQILNAEKCLKVLGYDINVDGYFDELTREAILKFQDKEDLSITGTLNQEVASTLNHKIYELINDENNDSQLQKALEILSK